MLIGGGSGIVPLMAILRTRAAAADRTPARLLYSSRTEADIIYRGERAHRSNHTEQALLAGRGKSANFRMRANAFRRGCRQRAR
jgi:ferredoxin-NADP reductase